MVKLYAMSKRDLRADLLLTQNIQTLLSVRGIEAHALATWCGHKPAWISKILNGDRGVPVKELGKIADFFGLTVAQLFQHGISPLSERRRAARRKGSERRTDYDRRQPVDYSRLHPTVQPSFPLPRHVETSRRHLHAQEDIVVASENQAPVESTVAQTEDVIREAK